MLPSEGLRGCGFLCSYPKSGRTWLRFILATYLARVYQLQLDVDLHKLFALLPNNDASGRRGVLGFRALGLADFPLILSDHAAWKSDFASAPVVFVARSVFDTLVSYYFHVVDVGGSFDGPISQFLEDRRWGLPRLIAYFNSWATALESSQVHATTYERMHADTIGEVRKVLEHFGLPVDEQALAAAVTSGSFESMRAVEVENGAPWTTAKPNSYRTRAGVVGGYREHISEALLGETKRRLQEGLSPGAVRVLSDLAVEPYR